MQRAINFYINLFAYSTVFPYLTGMVVMERMKYKNKKIQDIGKLANKLRSESYYPDFKQVVLTKIFTKISKDKNLKNTSLFNYTPEEIISFLKTNKIKKKEEIFFIFLF